MAKPKSLEEWGRSKARQRYAAGGVADTGNRGVADLVSDREAAQQARENAAARTSRSILKTREWNEPMKPLKSAEEE